MHFDHPEPHDSVMLRGVFVHAQAIAWRQVQPYHAILRNCIHFADFIVRVVTDGEVCGAPLIYDKLCGTVPEQQSPLLMMLYLTTMKTW